MDSKKRAMIKIISPVTDKELQNLVTYLKKIKDFEFIVNATGLEIR